MKKILIITILLIIISFSIYETNFILNKNIKNKISVNNKEVINRELEEYIVGVVAGEMPALYEEEALKAQAVAARTYAINKINNNEILYLDTRDQVYINIDDMKDKWKDNFDEYYLKIKKAVYDTKGEIIYYDNKPIKAFYYASSNGYTESCIDVFKEDIEYLEIIPSIDNNNYFKIEYNKIEFCNKLNISCNNIEISNINKNKSNRIDNITINDKTFTGIEIRNLLNLKSTDFEIKQNDNKILITTNGYGHGVGMSQKGANLLAKENYTYKDILEYYYPNTTIRNM